MTPLTLGGGRASAAWFQTYYSAKRTVALQAQRPSNRFWSAADLESHIPPGLMIPSAAEESVNGMTGQSERE
jgi:hypothetical protein